MAEPGVGVAWDALSRHLRRSGYTELWLQFRPRGSKDVLADVEAAVEVANQVVKDAGWGNEVFTEWVADSSAGPVAWMNRDRTEDGVRAWCVAFADHLVSLGKAGIGTTVRQKEFPNWLKASEVMSPPASAICPNTVVGTTSPLFAINHSWVAGSNFGHHSSILMR
jgi:hypothetical protein